MDEATKPHLLDRLRTRLIVSVVLGISLSLWIHWRNYREAPSLGFDVNGALYWTAVFSGIGLALTLLERVVAWIIWSVLRRWIQRRG